MKRTISRNRDLSGSKKRGGEGSSRGKGKEKIEGEAKGIREKENSLLSFPKNHFQKEKTRKESLRSENSKELRRHILGRNVSRQETLILA